MFKRGKGKRNIVAQDYFAISKLFLLILRNVVTLKSPQMTIQVQCISAYCVSSAPVCRHVQELMCFENCVQTSEVCRQTESARKALKCEEAVRNDGRLVCELHCSVVIYSGNRKQILFHKIHCHENRNSRTVRI